MNTEMKEWITDYVKIEIKINRYIKIKMKLNLKTEYKDKGEGECMWMKKRMKI